MIQAIFTLSSHLLFIFFAFQLLSTVVDWPKFVKTDADHSLGVRLFILLLSIALGYLVSLFFISIYSVSRDIFNGNL